MATILACGAGRVDAQTISNPFDSEHFFEDSSLNQRYDFVITVKTKVLRGHLDYAGSTLSPVTQMSVTYWQTGRLDPSLASEAVYYEEFWYHNCDAIGLQRYNAFKVNPNGQGIIRFIASPETSRSACAMANAASRLFLDIEFNRCSLAMIFVPADTVSDVADAFAKLNFFPFSPQAGAGVNAMIGLSLSSEPLGEKRYFYYKGSQF
jgi:hypothetical protein